MSEQKDLSPLTTAEEVKMVAMLARGDTQETIRKNMREFGRANVSNNTIVAVRKRNRENIEMLKDKLMAIEEADALSIKRKSNEIIKKRLHQVEQEDEIVAKANKEMIEGDMPHEIYERLMRTMKPTTLQELVAVSKEMHQQARLEPVEAPKSNTNNMEALAKAIEAGDEVILNQMIVNKSESTNAESISPTPKSV